MREYFINLARHEDRGEPARAKLRKQSEQSKGRLGAKEHENSGPPPVVSFGASIFLPGIDGEVLDRNQSDASRTTRYPKLTVPKSPWETLVKCPPCQ